MKKEPLEHKFISLLKRSILYEEYLDYFLSTPIKILIGIVEACVILRM
jgi:hypothetical protein